MRLDQYIATTYAFTRNKAQALISAGLVCVNGRVVTKTSYDVSGEEEFLIQADKSIEWVSRSAGKLDAFIEEIQRGPQDDFAASMHEIPVVSPKGPSPISFSGAYCLDIGSSTGGFTQVLLERGASHVDAVDVGSAQLHEKIKNDPRVTSYEQTDIRKFQPLDGVSGQGKVYDIITCDVSFISLSDIIDDILRFSHRETQIFLLFKPQFEVGRANLRKTGVPKDYRVIEGALSKFGQLLNHKCLKITRMLPARVIGEAGNQEWMYLIMKI